MTTKPTPSASSTRSYLIESTASGANLGVHKGETPRAALDAMARDAGYRDMDHAAEVTGDDGGHLIATLVSTS